MLLSISKNTRKEKALEIMNNYLRDKGVKDYILEFSLIPSMIGNRAMSKVVLTLFSREDELKANNFPTDLKIPSLSKYVLDDKNDYTKRSQYKSQEQVFAEEFSEVFLEQNPHTSEHGEDGYLNCAYRTAKILNHRYKYDFIEIVAEKCTIENLEVNINLDI